MSGIQPGPSPNVRHGRYLRFDWPAARLSSARAYSAVRHGGPTTFKPDPPAKHAGSSCHLSVVEGGQRFVEISITDDRLLVDGYAMLCVVADRIQIDQVAPLEALAETLGTWRSILARRTRMSPQVEVGLFGELLVVEALMRDGSVDVTGWRGGLSEEHDFGFADADFEVKTTSQERRHHWISGLQQMVPTGSTPLWLLSIQITRAGASQGRKLPQLVEGVRVAAPSETARAHLQTVLAAAGWRDEEADLFPDPWRQRSKAIALHVDAKFPAITPAHLARGGVDQAGIQQVSYEIDVTDRSTSPCVPVSLEGILTNLEIASA